MNRAEAKAAGATRYSSGRPCPRGHVAERMVANWTCVSCMLEKEQERRAAGLMADKDKGRYWRNPSGNNAKSRAQYQKHIDKRRAYEKTRNSKPDRHASICRRALEYAKRHPGKINALTAKRRARQKQATPPWLTQTMIAEMRAFYEAARAACVEVDHIVPLSGKTVCGLHVPWNLQHLPMPDNRRKGNRHGA